MEKCKLCGHLFNENELSEEHYPAKSVGNYDGIFAKICHGQSHIRREKSKRARNQRRSMGDDGKAISSFVA